MGGGVPRTAQFPAPEHPHPTGRLQLRDVPEVWKPHSQVPQRPQSAGSPEGPCPASWPPSLLAPPCAAPHGSPSSPVHHKSRAGPCSLCAPRRARTAQLTDKPKAMRDLPGCRLHRPEEQTAVASNQHPADPKEPAPGGVPHARHRTVPPAVTSTTGVHSSAIYVLQHRGGETQKVWRTFQNNTDLIYIASLLVHVLGTDRRSEAQTLSHHCFRSLTRAPGGAPPATAWDGSTAHNSRTPCDHQAPVPTSMGPHRPTRARARTHTGLRVYTANIRAPQNLVCDTGKHTGTRVHTHTPVGSEEDVQEERLPPRDHLVLKDRGASAWPHARLGVSAPCSSASDNRVWYPGRCCAAPTLPRGHHRHLPTQPGDHRSSSPQPGGLPSSTQGSVNGTAGASAFCSQGRCGTSRPSRNLRLAQRTSLLHRVLRTSPAQPVSGHPLTEPEREVWGRDLRVARTARWPACHTPWQCTGNAPRDRLGRCLREARAHFRG